MKDSPFYLIVHKESVEGALKYHVNNAYIQSVLAEIGNIENRVPEENLGRTHEDVEKHFLDFVGSEEKIGGKDRKILVCGGFYTADYWTGCVNLEMEDLKTRGYGNVEICEPATLVKETLWKDRRKGLPGNA
jgi:hypothetical protein